MRMSRKVAVLAAVSAVGALALTACAGQSGNNAPKGQLIYGADQSTPNWNPWISAGNVTANANAVVRVLPAPFLVNPQFKRVSTDLVAETPKVTSQSPFTVQYKLAKGADWYDATNKKTIPINADDFIFNWHLSDPNYAPYHSALKTPCASLGTGYDTIKGITGADSGKTVTVTFNHPYADWRTLFGQMLPKYAVDKGSGAATCKLFNTGWNSDKPLPFSGGPWMISSVDKTAQTFTETPNPKYWGKKPGLKKIIFKTIGTDTNTLINSMKNNEVQMIYPQPQLDMLKGLQGLKDFTTQVSYGLTWEHIDFNVTNKWLKDINLRKAIAMALDRKAILDKTVGQFDTSGQAKVMNNHAFVPGQPGYQNNAPPEYQTRHVAEAKTLLMKSGYKLSGGTLTKGGQPVKLNLVTTTNNALRKQTEEIIQNQLKDIGIALTTVQRDAATFFGGLTTNGSLTAGDFDIGEFAWVTGPELNSNNTLTYECVPGNKRTEAMNNYGLACDPKVDKMIKQVQSVTDTKTLQNDWDAIDKQLWKDVFTIPLYQKATLVSFNKKFKGIADNSTSTGPFWNSETWTESGS